MAIPPDLLTQTVQNQIVPSATPDAGTTAATPAPALDSNFSTTVRAPYLVADSQDANNQQQLSNPAASLAASARAPQSGTFSSKVAAVANKLGIAPGIGGWAKSLVASAVNSLGDASNVGEVPPGAGWLYGAEKTAAARDARISAQQDQQNKLQQQARENSRADQTLNLEKQRNQATIGEANSTEYLNAKIARNYDADFKNKNLAESQKDLQSAIDNGDEVLATGLTGADATARIQKDQASGTRDVGYISAYIPMSDKNGSPIVNADGTPSTQPVWTVVKPGKDVLLDKDKAAYLKKYGIDIPENTTVPADVYANVKKKADLARTLQQSVDEVQARIDASSSEAERNKAQMREANLSIDEKIQNRKAEAAFAPWLAQADGDVIIAFQNMSNDPKAKAQAGAVAVAYGPANIEKLRTSSIAELQKQIDDNNKELNNPTADLSEEEKLDLVTETKEAQASLNQYLGLSKFDPPQFAQAKLKLDPVAPERRAATIMAVDPSVWSNYEKAYLLRSYGLPIPPALLGTPVVPAPAK